MADPARAGRPKNSNPEAARAALLDAGEALFADHGFSGATMSAIAARAGVSKAMVRYYFGSKEKLWAAVIDGVVTAVLERVESSLPQGGAPDQAFEDYVGLLCEAIVSRPSFPRMLLRDYLDGEQMMRPETARSLMRFKQTTERLYQGGAETGRFRTLEPHILHLSIIGAAVFFTITMRYRAGITEHSDFAGLDLKSRAFIDQLKSTLLDGMRRPGPAPDETS